MFSTTLKNILALFKLEYKYGAVISKKKSLIEYPTPVLDRVNGNFLISSYLKGSSPFLAGRLGVTELYILLYYLHHRHKKVIPWTAYHGQIIWQQSGIFPSSESSLRKFSETYLNAIREIDIMGVWDNEGEDEVIRRFCKHAHLMALDSLEPYFYDEPWSKELASKKVLVIHPFADSILSQYLHNREKLFKNKGILPVFDLQVVKAVQAQVFNATSFNSWNEILQHLQGLILQKDFDVAIIGAGGYGLPLAAFVKKMGKQAIHIGGATQILFGIKGKRWESRPEFQSLFNKYWIHPSPDEKPGNATLLEEGAYW